MPTRSNKCSNGHERTPENTVLVAGKRQCKTCERSRTQAARERADRKRRRLGG